MTAARGREATEDALRGAAARLLSRGGVLAGLNLREVADEAGVNRGLVYQYFGSRRSLLRSALLHAARRNAADAASASGLPLRDRLAGLIRTNVRLPEAIRLTTLLVLDGDERARVLPNRGAGRAALAADAARGELASGDVDAVHAALTAAVYGYTLLREQLARETGVAAGDLDERVAACLGDLFTARPVPVPADDPPR
ncbi:TetR/AcrR family transcriptional regulator [Actinomadura parmotrematis]|uniref:TetR/AcrR family transcriptional regulator n=1 Tax=Actinomadura parmotrematis TaxID=2864039 RepID=A0ABS7FT21_9ACTN|nr:TetR/AcrR family transcriptional regulator [Actinomadura parmotrematis]MBW8483355.1 TetR/AcrR family transcriptional regulator [Actinomadura parmotrematis]